MSEDMSRVDKVLTEPVEPAPLQYNEPDLIAKAQEAADRLEKANEQMASLIQRQERLHVQNTLSGRASAGAQKVEESDAEYAAKALRGEIDDK